MPRLDQSLRRTVFDKKPSQAFTIENLLDLFPEHSIEYIRVSLHKLLKQEAIKEVPYYGGKRKTRTKAYQTTLSSSEEIESSIYLDKCNDIFLFLQKEPDKQHTLTDIHYELGYSKDTLRKCLFLLVSAKLIEEKNAARGSSFFHLTMHPPGEVLLEDIKDISLGGRKRIVENDAIEKPFILTSSHKAILSYLSANPSSSIHDLCESPQINLLPHSLRNYLKPLVHDGYVTKEKKGSKVFYSFIAFPSIDKEQTTR